MKRTTRLVLGFIRFVLPIDGGTLWPEGQRARNGQLGAFWERGSFRGRPCYWVKGIKHTTVQGWALPIWKSVFLGEFCHDPHAGLTRARMLVKILHLYTVWMKALKPRKKLACSHHLFKETNWVTKSDKLGQKQKVHTLTIGGALLSCHSYECGHVSKIIEKRQALARSDPWELSI